MREPSLNLQMLHTNICIKTMNFDKFEKNWNCLIWRVKRIHRRGVKSEWDIKILCMINHLYWATNVGDSLVNNTLKWWGCKYSYTATCFHTGQVCICTRAIKDSYTRYNFVENLNLNRLKLLDSNAHTINNDWLSFQNPSWLCWITQTIICNGHTCYNVEICNTVRYGKFINKIMKVPFVICCKHFNFHKLKLWKDMKLGKFLAESKHIICFSWRSIDC